MTTPPRPTFTSFDGWKRIAHGKLETNALAVKRATQAGSTRPILIFSDDTGDVVDVDLRGTAAQVTARMQKRLLAEAANNTDSAQDEESSSQPRGPGRPKLGVVAREVTLLPRHWAWLATQPGGASVALRKLVEEAKRSHANRDEKRKTQERAYKFISAMAGDMPDFEESTRALFAGDAKKFVRLTDQWPGDVRDYARRLARFVES